LTRMGERRKLESLGRDSEALRNCDGSSESFDLIRILPHSRHTFNKTMSLTDNISQFVTKFVTRAPNGYTNGRALIKRRLWSSRKTCVAQPFRAGLRERKTSFRTDGGFDPIAGAEGFGQ
jgi:hypothetical protein